MNLYARTLLVSLLILASLVGVDLRAKAAQTTSDTMETEVSGVTIDLGSSGEAMFVSNQPTVVDHPQYSLETISLERGTTFVIIDVMDGDVDIDDYMLTAEGDIAATYDYMDWLGGEWRADHSWDIYSGAYKLDYREIAYLELVHESDSNLYFGIGVYDSDIGFPDTIEWLQDNISIDGRGILSNASTSQIEAVINGSSIFTAEPVPMVETTVADWNDAGLVSETEWRSPLTNTSLTWDGMNIVFPFAQSDALVMDAEVTTLELRTSDRRGEVKLTTAVVDYTPADWVENLTSEEYLESQEAAGQPVTNLNSRVSDETGSVIVLHHTDFGHPVVTITDVYVNADGVTILTEIAAAPEDIAEVYATFWDSVQSNGEYYPLTWTIEDIEALSVD